MRTRRQLIVPIMVALLLALSAGCGPAQTPESSPEPVSSPTEPTAMETPTASEPTATRGQLVIAMAEEPEVLDVQQAGWSSLPHQILSQAPVMYDLEMKQLVPGWVESWDVSEDGKVIVFHLPEGYMYSNGDPLDAQALADTWWRYKDPELSMYPEDLEPIAETNVIDETTLEVVFSDPPAAMWAVLVSEWGAPWDVAEAERIGDDEFGRHPVASGPFKLEEWVEGSQMLLSRNENHRTKLPFLENQGPPYLDEVLVRFIPEALTRVSELEAGTVDVILDVPTSELARLRDHPEIEVLEASAPGISYLAINHARAPLDDVLVRSAIAAAINRDDIVSTLEGTAQAQHSFLAPAQVCYSQEVETYAKERHAFDVDAAKALLTQAGWTDTDGDGVVDKDGTPLAVEMLVPPDDPMREKIGVVVQAQLKAIGLDVSIVNLPSDYILSTLADGDYDLALDEVVWSDPDALAYIYDYPNYSNPDVEDKLDQGRYTMDLAERTALYSEIQTQLIDDVFSVPLFARSEYIGIRTWVKDLVVHGPLYGTLHLNDVTIVE
jgi:peptide/nickel transport system substrate-binding protein